MKPTAQRFTIVVLSFFLGMTALLVSFIAASAFEGTTFREVTAECVAAALYLAFCQFWVAPRGSNFVAKLPILGASITPLLLNLAFANEISLINRLLWLASGCLGSVIGALIAQWVTATPPRGTPTADSINRGRSNRRYLQVGFVLLVAVAVVIPIGVIPLVVADIAHHSHAHTNGKFLGITVVFDLLAVAILASALWRPSERDPSSKGTLGTTAFLALLLSLIYCGMGVLFSGYGPALQIASVLLFLCAVFGLITTALMTVTSVIEDRARFAA